MQITYWVIRQNYKNSGICLLNRGISEVGLEDKYFEDLATVVTGRIPTGRGGGGSAMDYYLELRFSRPQLEAESE
jgi:hypothetical protein